MELGVGVDRMCLSRDEQPRKCSTVDTTSNPLQQLEITYMYLHEIGRRMCALIMLLKLMMIACMSVTVVTSIRLSRLTGCRLPQFDIFGINYLLN